MAMETSDPEAINVTSRLPSAPARAYPPFALKFSSVCSVRRHGRPWRERESTEGVEDVVSASPQHSAVSIISHGRYTFKFGIARKLERCSTGWCVGPSSPKPMESCVIT